MSKTNMWISSLLSTGTSLAANCVSLIPLQIGDTMTSASKKARALRTLVNNLYVEVKNLGTINTANGQNVDQAKSEAELARRHADQAELVGSHLLFLSYILMLRQQTSKTVNYSHAIQTYCYKSCQTGNSTIYYCFCCILSLKRMYLELLWLYAEYLLIYIVTVLHYKCLFLGFQDNWIKLYGSTGEDCWATQRKSVGLREICGIIEEGGSACHIADFK